MLRCVVLGIIWVIVVIGITHFVTYGLGITP
jgi:hypothetical protein